MIAQSNAVSLMRFDAVPAKNFVFLYDLLLQ